MALTRVTTYFDVHDAKVYKLSTDVAGASPTYTAGIDVPGISEISLDPQITAALLKGDARILDRKSRIDSFQFSLTYSRLSLDVIDAVVGSTGSTSGTTPNRRQDSVVLGNVQMPYYKLEVAINDTDTGLGTFNIVLYKAKTTGGTLVSGQTDEYGRPQLQGEAIPAEGTITINSVAHVNPLARFTLFESLTALP